MTNHNLCDSCETVAHCLKNGCVPKVPIVSNDPGIYEFWARHKELQHGRELKLAMAEANDQRLESLAELQAQQEPLAWIEMVVANLVREGVNKHKARELAQHFYTSPPAQQECRYNQGQVCHVCDPILPAQRKPLTDEQIGQDPIFRAGVRFAEAAHGIKP